MFNIDFLNIWAQMGIISRTLAFLFLLIFLINLVRIFLKWDRGFALVSSVCSGGVFLLLIYIAFAFELKLLFIAPFVLILALAMSKLARMAVRNHYNPETDETIFSIQGNTK